ncbi:hypothetical protein CALVIDRAFT_530316 [Calocera viscosa TUFC12733]|uniref:Uncharacterized protein n=1 Tax=Calocera viscosa (strain TUFC12733) TaxID=1330018 RepID=A0A167I141_CALVF|nr:hypothetical protein CALVIDRAFT_530316 [Calocera viscosa TUFC12733]
MPKYTLLGYHLKKEAWHKWVDFHPETDDDFLLLKDLTQIKFMDVEMYKVFRGAFPLTPEDGPASARPDDLFLATRENPKTAEELDESPEDLAAKQKAREYGLDPDTLTWNWADCCTRERVSGQNR